MPLVGLTAWQSLVDIAGVRAGQRVLIHGAGGGLLVTAVERLSTTLPHLATEAGVRFAAVGVEPDHVALEHLAALADAGVVRPYVQTTLRLEDATKAHEIAAAGGVQGKIVLTM